MPYEEEDTDLHNLLYYIQITEACILLLTYILNTEALKDIALFSTPPLININVFSCHTHKHTIT